MPPEKTDCRSYNNADFEKGEKHVSSNGRENGSNSNLGPIQPVIVLANVHHEQSKALVEPGTNFASTLVLSLGRGNSTI
ncbi:hypothetical protein SBA5_390004 [Candidatus Sulfotelmatomonas gaucii]|uniref:Uncharacterized protein n=1 Tax=Candidatus Sulfuritelmatomonas gaucii TaxID=2043161 RepID=A0A2N9LJE5_9BACT|nr:hypothetical protein SBA5_390004 [Candidatus Sulfotelmatomonas gaucii]